MRTLKSKDLFAALRVVKEVGIKDEMRRMAELVKDGKINTKEQAELYFSKTDKTLFKAPTLFSVEKIRLILLTSFFKGLFLVIKINLVVLFFSSLIFFSIIGILYKFAQYSLPIADIVLSFFNKDFTAPDVDKTGVISTLFPQLL